MLIRPVQNNAMQLNGPRPTVTFMWRIWGLVCFTVYSWWQQGRKQLFLLFIKKPVPKIEIWVPCVAARREYKFQMWILFITSLNNIYKPNFQSFIINFYVFFSFNYIIVGLYNFVANLACFISRVIFSGRIKKI